MLIGMLTVSSRYHAKEDAALQAKFIHIHAYRSITTHAHTHTCTYTHTHIHACMYTHTHTHTHACKNYTHTRKNTHNVGYERVLYNTTIIRLSAEFSLLCL